MIKSMTGYGRAVELIDGREITVEIKSVNHRFFEPSIKLPRAFSYFEQRLKETVSPLVSRGKVELSVNIADTAESDTVVRASLSAAKMYVDAVDELAKEFSLKNDLTATMLSKYPDVLTTEKRETDEDTVWQGIEKVAKAALTQFIDMRNAEGAKLAEDISARCLNIEQLLSGIEQQADDNRSRYIARLTSKMSEVLGDTNIDSARILQEAAIFADRSAIDEETVRLHSHIAQLRGFIESDEPIGKKMDFLVQEFNREANTIGSKANNLETTKLVVELKSEIEKIREQVQNIE